MPRRSIGDVIETAVAHAKINYPNTESGTVWDQHVMSTEEAKLLTKAVLIALHEEGYVIAPAPEEES
jgi:hypothetical protein